MGNLQLSSLSSLLQQQPQGGQERQQKQRLDLVKITDYTDEAAGQRRVKSESRQPPYGLDWAKSSLIQTCCFEIVLESLLSFLPLEWG